MEKIKKALDQARTIRNNTSVLASRPRYAAQGKQKNLATKISYEHTKRLVLQVAHLRKNRILAGEDGIWVSDAYKVLRTRVLQCMRENKWNSLAVTSPTGGNGKTVTAINLAISISKEVNQTVLLVDLDLRNPKIGKYFSTEELPGISDYLDGNCKISDILFNPDMERLVVLPGNKTYSNSSEMLSSPVMLGLVSELKNFYSSRIVIFDLPPILLCDDMLAFSPYVDSTILVAEEGKSKKEEVKRAYQMIDQRKYIGLVLNKSSEDVSAYSY
jgi:capsular exopolysaccharide synthesis family protein